MKGAVKILALWLPALLMAVPAAANDAEVELRYWYNRATLSISGEEEEFDGAPGFGLRAEIVPLKRLTLAGEYYEGSGEDSLDGSDFSQVILDAKWRVIAPTNDTFFAVGLGYQTLEISNGESIDTSGVRLVADGRFGWEGLVYVYGRLGYLPSLSDLDLYGIPIAEGDSGIDFDIGLGIEPIPVLSVWVGYRIQKFDFSEIGGSGSLSIENIGPYVGLGVHF